MLNCKSREAKRTCSIVKQIILKRSKHVYIEEFKYQSKVNTFVNFENLFQSEANMFIFNNLNIEAKRSKLSLTQAKQT